MKKKKLLVFASTFPRWKGDTIPPFVYELSKRLKNDFEVYVLAPSFPGAKDYEKMDGMHVYRFRYFFEKFEKLAGGGGILPTLKKNKWFYFQVPFFMLGEYFALKKLIKKINPDVIHSHWIIPQGFVTALGSKKPFVVTSHGSDIMGLKGFSWMKKYALSRAKNITVVSNALKDELLKMDSSLKVDVIPMGVDTNLFNVKKSKRKNSRESSLLFVGRLAPEKGIDLLVESMPKVLEKKQNTKLTIIGDGPLKKQLEQRVAELNLKEKVTFVGWIDNKKLPEHYSKSDVFVSPSVREGFGLTFVEAGMCGCWLVGTDTGGIRDIIKNGKNGYVVKEGDVKDLEKKILQSLGRKRTVFDFSKFGWDVVSKKYARLLA